MKSTKLILVAMAAILMSVSAAPLPSEHHLLPTAEETHLLNEMARRGIQFESAEIEANAVSDVAPPATYHLYKRRFYSDLERRELDPAATAPSETTTSTATATQTSAPTPTNSARTAPPPNVIVKVVMPDVFKHVIQILPVSGTVFGSRIVHSTPMVTTTSPFFSTYRSPWNNIGALFRTRISRRSEVDTENTQSVRSVNVPWWRF